MRRMSGFADAREVWDRRFASADGLLFGEAPNRWLSQHAAIIAAGSSVLCVADGEGRNGVALARLGHRVTSFDVSPVGVAKARALASAADVALDARVCDVDLWDWEPDRFDAVVAIFVQFAPPAMRARLFAGIARTLAPGGVLVVEGYGRRQLAFRTGGPGVLENLYTLPALLNAFPRWEILAARDAVVVLDEGRGHSGPSHSIAAVLRRPPAGARPIRG